MNFKNTTTKEIENIIICLTAKDFHRYDGITTKLSMIIAPVISSPLSYIFNKCVISAIFPTTLKYAIINQFLKMEIKM